MNKIKIKALLVLFALVTVITPATWAAFPVNKAKTEQTQNSNAPVQAGMSAAAVAKATTLVSAKTAKKEAKLSFLEKLMRGGKSQIVAALLAGLIGALGIHRFYLGYTWQGIVQLLTLGGCGIWALIDFIRILTGNLEPKNEPYETTF